MLTNLFYATAWPMKTIVPYSFFHLTLAGVGIVLSVLFALLLAKAEQISAESVLFLSGLVLALTELYKQGFLTIVVNHGRYDWWYFPFQLCSIPMYLSLFYPVVRSVLPLQKTFATFLYDFGFLGGIMALVVPDGFLHPYWILTIHGFLWHFILIFLGTYCARKGLADLTNQGFLKTLSLYMACCGTACLINITLWYAIPGSYTNMFYLNCLFPSEQPLFYQISLIFGNLWGHISYLLATSLGALFIHKLGSLTVSHGMN